MPVRIVDIPVSKSFRMGLLSPSLMLKCGRALNNTPLSAYASNLKKLIKCYINFYPQFYQYALYFDIVFIELFFTQYSVTCRAGESYCSTAHSTGLDKKEINPVLQLKLIKSCPGPCFVKEIGLSLKGTTLLTDLTHLSLYRVAGKRGFLTGKSVSTQLLPL